jgi:hypothetical protein
MAATWKGKDSNKIVKLQNDLTEGLNLARTITCAAVKLAARFSESFRAIKVVQVADLADN